MTKMSRVERRKAHNLYEQQKDVFEEEHVDQQDETLPSRQSVKDQRKKKQEKAKTKTPLFTVLAVLFVFVPIIVFVSLLYFTKSDPFNPNKDYEDVFIDSSQSKYESLPKARKQQETEDTVALQDSAKKTKDQETDKKTEDLESSVSKKEQAKGNKPSESKKEQAEDNKPSENKKEPTEEKESSIHKKVDTKANEKSESNASAAAAPEETKTVQKDTQQAQTKEDATRVVKHTVKKKETLYRISMKYYKSRAGEDKIRNYNNLNGNEVYTGQVLNIPLTN
ncbi:LysM peptidoglycan-binding domain-containing protein [Bacillus atrophaeus]|uniref:LysM peptidoglycan-binding domain-containing protein n=1 Tax=Bacillus atrophaeus TaxID=1452 RepID=UPI00227FC4DB|nr:LysM peptidoglycan-binding domain-containing protein [Bacillus atrophaeus]MCY8837168.1 LysM peptidoglycan-binding domain-containing protein [Bacillus atrophaeus]MEC5220448.1 LysM peptidoglycan-binding domain-containing protein [Bacillus atrophaeus]MED4577523.1 LysM peptidoglycan-binding domain-containing protein [Bacillus atrophaeus]MED4721135.1 LysM peptidoglycan-binding domain-containing protein [Bacillus atrophaeus]MED4813731.1 LysM peptidoglycan-binding domain-containing protein [Bacill